MPRLKLQPQALLNWFDQYRRPLPWRRSRNSYRVWVAEVMLQQTRIAVVVPAFERFVARFPTIAALAQADEEAVLSLWSGLGYYSRARALHRAAQQLDAAGARRFPRTFEEARRLPGVGRYTAAAVLSIAYGNLHAAVDGNVVRVLSRLFRINSSDVAAYHELAQELLDRQRPGDWNQALMELGETLCTPRAPHCATCPLESSCEAFRKGDVARYPPAKVRRTRERIAIRVVLQRDRSGRLLLRRGEFSYLPHLWLPPIEILSAAQRTDFRHAILHRDFAVTVEVRRNVGRATRRASDRWVSEPELAALGRSSLLTKALAHETRRA